ncbi:hypothetical protein [Acinetobacter baumannii]|uniref:hypothetical protein n=1 Tax=Acinetobacter baumannii TaxID=470 RepID=UPI00294A6BB2|nr:hypothetical protein [Acinetobacter baumannii]MDV5263222.1 hypothetical protein [Acinetobacter baumannii]
MLYLLISTSCATWHVPYKKNLIELRNEIEPFCVHRVHPVTLDNIILYAHNRIELMQMLGLDAVTIRDRKITT